MSVYITAHWEIDNKKGNGSDNILRIYHQQSIRPHLLWFAEPLNGAIPAGDEFWSWAYEMFHIYISTMTSPVFHTVASDPETYVIAKEL